MDLHHYGGKPAFLFNRDKTYSGEYGFKVEKFSILEVDSEGAVIKTDLSRNNDIKFNVDQRSEVNLISSGSGSGISSI